MVPLFIDLKKKTTLIWEGFKRSEIIQILLFHLSMSAASLAPPGGLTQPVPYIVQYPRSFRGLDKPWMAPKEGPLAPLMLSNPPQVRGMMDRRYGRGSLFYLFLLTTRFCDGWNGRQRRHGKELEEMGNKEQNFHQLKKERRHLRN